MPRPSLDNPIVAVISEYAYLKQPDLDVVADFERILKYQLDCFKDQLDEDKLIRMQKKLHCASQISHTPLHKNRLYIITNADIPQLILFDVEDCILENIKNSIYMCGLDEPAIIHPKYAATIFIFQKSEELFIGDISSHLLAELLRCFHADNKLSNARVRDSWYGFPRRQNRKQK